MRPPCGRRGLFGANWSYVLSARPVLDDVSTDPLQLDAPAVDAALVLVTLLSLGLILAPEPTLQLARPLLVGEGALAARRMLALALAARLLLPLFDVMTTRDLAERLGLGWRSDETRRRE